MARSKYSETSVNISLFFNGRQLKRGQTVLADNENSSIHTEQHVEERLVLPDYYQEKKTKCIHDTAMTS
jgi:hypothetical protein